jgi:hypothetical protein
VTPTEARAYWDTWTRAYHRHGVRFQPSRPRVYLWRTRKNGYPINAETVEEGDRTPKELLDLVFATADELVKRPNKMSDIPVTGVPLRDEVAAKRWPQLWEYLTAKAYDDGSPRVTSSLLIFEQEGTLKGMLRDKDGDRCLWVAARGLIDLLECLDGQLGDDQADWRPDRKEKGQSAPRGKRAG